MAAWLTGSPLPDGPDGEQFYEAPINQHLLIGMRRPAACALRSAPDQLPSRKLQELSRAGVPVR